jgi:hypothetical protein
MKGVKDDGVATKYGLFYLRYGWSCGAVRKNLFWGSESVDWRYGSAMERGAEPDVKPYCKSRLIDVEATGCMEIKHLRLGSLARIPVLGIK